MRTIIIAVALILAAVGGYAFKEFAVAKDEAASLTQDQVNVAISQYLKDHPDEIVAASQQPRRWLTRRRRFSTTPPTP
jgi:hypothetical protein